MSLPDIRTLVPHSGTMVLLDTLVAVGEESLCAEVVISPDTLFSDAHGVGAWIGVEYMAQAVAAFAGYEALSRGEPVKVGFLLGSRRYECRHPQFAIGSKLHIHVHRALQGENGLGAFSCHIDDANEPSAAPLATATITVFQPDNVGEFLQKVSE
ncbi:3-hydroxylacyl-ACP dehydratase [Herminiimonas aquatilis]|uniref:3-hydroxylacyl-ACP dehydratase n=1 Tax=Herminiimonas aquatilis TaxID=345342 RepID=A0ABW2J2E8_9BURK